VLCSPPGSTKDSLMTPPCLADGHAIVVKAAWNVVLLAASARVLNWQGV
jgi:hypothetical protein